MQRIVYICISVTFLLCVANSAVAMQATESVYKTTEKPLIRNVVVEGNTLVPTNTVLAKVPFKQGDLFNTKKTANIIRSLYTLGYFRNIQIILDDVEQGVVDLIIVVTEKNKVSGVSFEGNTVINSDKLSVGINSSFIKTLDVEELKSLEEQIQKLYREKNYHHVAVTGSLEPDDQGTYRAHFVIKEGYRSTIKRIDFTGNENIADRFLREKMVSREDWILGILDRSGTYHPDAIMRDKYVIEDLYQSNGYLTARVKDILIDENDYGEMHLTFVIHEGEQYIISDVGAPANELLTEQQMLMNIPIVPGQLFSKDLIRKTMENLRIMLGQFGYIYADVQPSVRPNEQDKTVSIIFNTDLGNQITVNRINIIGNKKTRDRVIRREILFNEGDLLTSWLMDESKRRVEMLGFFDQKDGVVWKIIKLDEETADLELVVQEIKTGRIQAKMGFGPGSAVDPNSTTKNFSVNLDLGDTNFRGTGIMYNFTGSWSEQERLFNLALANRWFFDRPIFGGANFYVRNTTYSDFALTQTPPVEKTIGCNGSLGFRMDRIFALNVGTAVAFERIRYDRDVIARTISEDPNQQAAFQTSVSRSFQPGDLVSMGFSFSQDLRNHPMYPTNGYQWSFDTKVGIPHGQSGSGLASFGFFKLEFNGDWYAPLIPQYGLALRLHAFVGNVHLLSGHTVPYRDLFHIGGPASVRGFTYGQISPSLQGSSLGATKGFTITTELQFPITEDYNMRGVIFYDGGAGWDTPDAGTIPAGFLYNNSFDFRHAIGFGFRLNSPTPICFDWGFKLDPRKKRGESLSEVHISASQAF